MRSKGIIVFVLWCGVAFGQERTVPATQVEQVGGFVGGRLTRNRDNFLKSFPIGKYVAMLEERKHVVWDWRQGEQPGKWLESAILTRMPEAHAVYERMLKVQAPDGYLGVSEKPLRGMDAYELYFTQHALLTAYEVWKDRRGLKAARRLGDYFLEHIGPGKEESWPSSVHAPENKGKVLKGTMHSEIAGHSIHYSWEGTLLIDPMMRLYQLTGDKRYFDWCKWVVSNIDKWSGWDAYSNLDKVADGAMGIDKVQPYVHTHTFQMNFLGLLRMYEVSGDTNYLRKVVGAWNDISRRQLYITGGVSVGEHYEKDYIKPLTGEMMETCATMSWIQLSEYLLELTGDPKYADAIERICWNQVFAEQTIDGDANHYFTPPNGVTPRGYFREPDCCMGSGHRLLSMLPGFIYGTGKGGDIYVNQFIPSTVRIGKVEVKQETNFPEDGKVVIYVSPAVPAAFAVRVRVPGWCKAPVVEVNGEAVPGVVPGTYVVVHRVWKKGDKIDVLLPMELRWVRHEHYLKVSDRKPYKTSVDGDAPYALERGPVVYAVDDIWYKGDTADFAGSLDSVKYVLAPVSGLRWVGAPAGILGPGYEVPLVLANGKAVTMPVYPFANIGKWYRDAAHKPDSNAATWKYAIWLKGMAPVVLSLPKIFEDNMVLQRGRKVPVLGRASPGSGVSVEFGGMEQTAVADGRGDWRVELGPMEASAVGREMVVRSDKGEEVRFGNVLVGEVWLCSGQSNMEYTMRKNSKFDTVEEAGNPEIRLFLVGTHYSKPETRGVWGLAVGEALRGFSAPGYFFARELHKRLGVPVGVISNAVPGSAIEPYLGDTGKFFLTMVRPLAPYGIKGFCWYQGETNCMMNDTVAYPGKMKRLIEGWRGIWGDSALGFYFVQIAPFYYSKSNGGNQAHSVESEADFWGAQEKALALSHTGMVVTSDLVDSLQDLHPGHKREVGRRLALWALAKDYGLPVVYSGPVFGSAVVRGRKVELGFSEVGSGLVSRDGKGLDWFEVAGADGRFVAAKAKIQGSDKIVVVSPVKDPRLVRFGWNEAAQPNLLNKEGLPAMPFRVNVDR